MPTQATVLAASILLSPDVATVEFTYACSLAIFACNMAGNNWLELYGSELPVITEATRSVSGFRRAHGERDANTRFCQEDYLLPDVAGRVTCRLPGAHRPHIPKETTMNRIADEHIDQTTDQAASYFTYEISDEALEAAATSILLSGSSNPGRNCTGGCR